PCPLLRHHANSGSRTQERMDCETVCLGSWVLGLGSWVLGLGPWVLRRFRSATSQDPGLRTQDPGPATPGKWAKLAPGPALHLFVVVVIGDAEFPVAGEAGEFRIVTGFLHIGADRAQAVR